MPTSREINEAMGRAISDQVMSGQLPQYLTTGVPKKAVHVKWAGRSIALGTFPLEEGKEKCTRAKALTKAWRCTMRPKPSREWVIEELERLQVRVVSGGRGSKVGDEQVDEELIDEDTESDTDDVPPSRASKTDDNEEAVTASLLCLANSASGGVSRSSGGAPDSNDSGAETSAELRPSSFASNSLQAESPTNGSAGRNLAGLGETAIVGPGQIPFSVLSSADAPGSAGLSLVDNQIGPAGDGYALQMGNPSVDPNHHYEMLKLHHMNLLQELEETTLMMNLHQQQLLDQQQQSMQQLQEQLSDPSNAGAFDMMASSFSGGLQPSISGGELSAMGAHVSRFNERYFGGNSQDQSLFQAGNSMGIANLDGSVQQRQRITQGEHFETQTSRRNESSDEVQRLREELAEKQRQLDSLLNHVSGGATKRSGDTTYHTDHPSARRRHY